MPIIKKTDFVEGDPLKELRKSVELTNKKVIKGTEINKQYAESLNAIKKSSDGTEARKLVATTDKLARSTKKLKEEKSESQRVSEKLIKANNKLKETYTREAKALEIVKQKTLQQNKALREQAKASLGVQKSTNGLISGLKNMGKQLAGGLGLVALFGLLANQFNKASQRSSELVKSTNKLKNTFDLTTKQAKKMAIQINAIANNFEGVDVQNLEVSLAAITGAFKDISESEALDLIQEGFQKGSNNSGEFLDILKEYPVQFKAAGIDARTMFAIINQQVKQGIYSDKGVDAIKEGGLRLRENTKAVQEALKPLDDSIKLQIKQEIAAGNSFKAIQLVSEALKDTSLTAEETQTIIADVFGGAGEDAGIEYIKTLADIETNLDNVAKQTTINEDANLRLTTSYNAFILSVSDGDGVISRSFANIKDGFASFLEGIEKINSEGFGTKMKVMANGVLSVVNAISFGGLDKALKNVTQSEEAWRFDTDKTISSLKIQKTEIDKNTGSTRRLTTAEKEEAAQLEKSTTARNKNTKALKENREEKSGRGGAEGIADSGEILGFTLPEGADGGIDPVKFNDEQNDKKLASDKAYFDETVRLDKEANEKKKKRAEELEAARKEIGEAAINAGIQIASDIFAAGQDDKINKLNQDAEAEKAILQNKLEQGLITEAQFKKKSAAIDKKVKLETAKADKKKAIFDIAIATAVGIARSIPNPVAMALAAALGAIQLAAVIARPLPKFEKGGKIGGERHSNGGTIIEAEKDEFMLSRKGYAGAEGISDMINRGLIKDSDIGLLKNQGNYNPSMLQLNGLINKFDENIKNTHQTNKYLENMYSTHTKNGMVYIMKSDGTPSQHTTK